MAALHRHDRMSYHDTSIRRVDWEKDLARVRRLFREYRDWISEHRDVDDPASSIGLAQIDRQVAELPGDYGPPRGDVLLAHLRGAVVACGALREIEPRIGEIKRIYVRADHRGPGFGPILTRALLRRARLLGYERIRVDTLPTMAAAIQFYQDLGFSPRSAYWPHPVRGALFFEYAFNPLPQGRGSRKRRAESRHGTTTGARR
jgi:ribosomal protein S18 acetylase RimI-like enzyme